MSDPSDFHEVWWIYSPLPDPWAGLRLAHFRKSMNGEDIIIIQAEGDPRRIGVRIWNDIKDRERWFKIAKADIPTPEMIQAVLFTWASEAIQGAITCPTCGRESYNQHDIRERYCGFCHKYHVDMVPHAPAVHSKDR